jgi:hypothetical protein
LWSIDEINGWREEEEIEREKERKRKGRQLSELNRLGWAVYNFVSFYFDDHAILCDISGSKHGK